MRFFNSIILAILSISVLKAALVPAPTWAFILPTPAPTWGWIAPVPTPAPTWAWINPVPSPTLKWIPPVICCDVASKTQGICREGCECCPDGTWAGSFGDGKTFNCDGITCSNDKMSIYPLCGGTICPTTSPTNYPTTRPSQFTKTPTKSPTNKPTKFPTQYPTTKPSKNPTITPSKYPSNTPSQNPSDAPTQNPSNKPTLVPSLAPSNKPTITPTTTPSKYPTTAPSKYPSNTPSQKPSNTPTLVPSLAPSNKPTKNPTKYPTMTLTTTTIATSTKEAAIFGGICREGCACCPDGQWSGSIGDGKTFHCLGSACRKDDSNDGKKTSNPLPICGGTICETEPTTTVTEESCCDPTEAAVFGGICREGCACCPNGQWSGSIGDGHTFYCGMSACSNDGYNSLPLCGGTICGILTETTTTTATLSTELKSTETTMNSITEATTTKTETSQTTVAGTVITDPLREGEVGTIVTENDTLEIEYIYIYGTRHELSIVFMAIALILVIFCCIISLICYCTRKKKKLKTQTEQINNTQDSTNEIEGDFLTKTEIATPENTNRMESDALENGELLEQNISNEKNGINGIMHNDIMHITAVQSDISDTENDSNVDMYGNNEQNGINNNMHITRVQSDVSDTENGSNVDDMYGINKVTSQSEIIEGDSSDSIIEMYEPNEKQVKTRE